MDLRKAFSFKLRITIIVILSSFLSHVSFSFASLFLDNNGLIIIIDTAIYSYVVGVITMLISQIIELYTTTVHFEIISTKQRSNIIYMNDEPDRFTLVIHIKGELKYLPHDFKVIEPQGTTIQLLNKPSYIINEDDNSYKININKLINVAPGQKNKNFEGIRREVEFDIIVDTLEQTYEDVIQISGMTPWRDFWRLHSIDQNKLTIRKRS